MAGTVTVYGIPNCDTVRKARKWLAEQNVEHQFHDVRSQPLPIDTLQHWAEQVGIDTLVNKRSTSWRQLTEAQQQANDAELMMLIQEYPTLMKRPVLDAGKPPVQVGFQVSQWQDYLAL